MEPVPSKARFPKGCGCIDAEYVYYRVLRTPYGEYQLALPN